MKEKILIALRWLCFLPTSILGAWLAYIISVWLSRCVNGFTIWNCVIDIVSSALMGAMYMYIGYFMVPSHKKVVGLCMFGLACVYCGIAITANILNGFSWYSLICTLFLIGGAGYVCYSIAHDEMD